MKRIANLIVELDHRVDGHPAAGTIRAYLLAILYILRGKV